MKNTITIGKQTFTILFPDLLRPLTKLEREDLKSSIKAQGVQVRIVLDESGGIIDGVNRLTLAAELRIDLETIPFDDKGLPDWTTVVTSGSGVTGHVFGCDTNSCTVPQP